MSIAGATGLACASIRLRKHASELVIRSPRASGRRTTSGLSTNDCAEGRDFQGNCRCVSSTGDGPRRRVPTKRSSTISRSSCKETERMSDTTFNRAEQRFGKKGMFGYDRHQRLLHVPCDATEHGALSVHGRRSPPVTFPKLIYRGDVPGHEQTEGGAEAVRPSGAAVSLKATAPRRCRPSGSGRHSPTAASARSAGRAARTGTACRP